MRNSPFGSFFFRNLLPLCAALLLALMPVWTAAADRRIIVLPLESVSPDAAPWIGQAVQKDLLAELSNLPGVAAAAGNQSVQSPDAALAAGRQHQADLVLFGSYQMIGRQIRLNAQLLDTQSGQALGAAQATGTLRDLFALEDHLAHHVKGLLNQPPAPATQPAASAPPKITPTGPVQTGDYGPYGAYGLFNGSSLQRAIQSGNLGVPPPPKLEDENGSDNRYFYGTPTYPFYPGGYGFWYFPSVRYYTAPPTIRPPAQTPFTPQRTLPPSNVQGYFPVTLQPR
jgi:TolB-like protein